MNLAADDPRSSRRWLLYWLLIASSVAGMVTRVLLVQSKSGRTPFLSANDRSRWCTIRSLVDLGTYEIDDVVFPNGKRDRDWQTIDMVKHRAADGREHYYSSKPPLLPTLLAGEYWLIQKLTGATLKDRPFFVSRILLITVNVLPLLAAFLVLARIVERYGTSDWGRLLVMAAATWGTFLTTFAVTLNNHVPAAVCVVFTIDLALRIWVEGERRWPFFFAAGLCGAFLVTNELPALSYFVFLTAVLFWLAPGRVLAGYVPGALLVTAAFFYTNYLAHGVWRPAYGHRGDGAIVATITSPIVDALDAETVPEPVVKALRAKGVDISPAATITKTHDIRWVLWDEDGAERYAVLQAGGQFEIRAWANWYEYDGSYWTGPRQGVDRGEPNVFVYAFHVLVGHHGVFSLTPLWVLSACGFWRALRGAATPIPRGFVTLIVVTTVVCFAFYLSRPLIDRNYGGVACGFRWVFWLGPLWLLGLLIEADAAQGKRALQWGGATALAISVFSAAYAWLNPWTNPWLYDVLAR